MADSLSHYRARYSAAYLHAAGALAANDAAGREDLELSVVLGLVRAAAHDGCDAASRAGTCAALADWQPAAERRHAARREAVG